MRLRRAVGTTAGLTLWMATCDRLFHLDTGTLVHHWHPQIQGQTVWVLGFFGVGAASLVALASRLRPARHLPLWFELALLTVLYGISGWFGLAHPLAVTLGFAGLAALRLALADDKPTVLGLTLLFIVAGPATESFAWAIGMFSYTQPDFLGVPWWLFGFYANAVWATRALGSALTTTNTLARAA